MTLSKLAIALPLIIAAVAGWGSARAASAASVGSAAGVLSVNAARKKNPGDLSYRTMWRMQKRVAAMRPKNARLISPSLRLSIDGMGKAERAEFMPDSWGVAIVGKTIGIQVPMRRGGYFEVPPLPQAQARGEDAIVMFNAQTRKKSLDVGWHVAVPSPGMLAYRQFAQALDELRLAQQEMPWWDIIAMAEKNARFDAIRACFRSDQGQILVAGAPAGTKLSRHCTLLAFDAAHVEADPAIAFVGGLDYVTLDNSAKYLNFEEIGS